MQNSSKGGVGRIKGTEVGRSGRRIQDQGGARLGLWEEWQGWGVGPLASKVWIQPESLAGSAPRPCGHQDLSRIFQAQVIEASAELRGPAFVYGSKRGTADKHAVLLVCPTAARKQLEAMCLGSDYKVQPPC